MKANRENWMEVTITQEVIGYDVGGKDNVVGTRCLLRSVSVR